MLREILTWIVGANGGILFALLLSACAIYWNPDPFKGDPKVVPTTHKGALYLGFALLMLLTILATIWRLSPPVGMPLLPITWRMLIELPAFALINYAMWPLMTGRWRKRPRQKEEILQHLYDRERERRVLQSNITTELLAAADLAASKLEEAAKKADPTNDGHEPDCK